MIPRWLVLSLLATLIWAVWGIVSALVSRDAAPLAIQVVSTAGLVPISLLLLFSPRWKQATNRPRGIAFATATSLCAVSGNMSLLQALNLGGPVAIVLPLSAMYPLVTAILAVLFLRERFNRVQGIGFALALVAIYLIGVATSGAPAGERFQRLPLEAFSQPWMLWALSALVLFGLTSFFQKIATFHISDEFCTVIYALATVPVAAGIMAFVPGVSLDFGPKVWGLAIVYGALLGLGSLAMFGAYRLGKASIVTAVTGLYPAGTVLLAVPLLSERLDGLRLVAVAVAIAAGMALSYEPAKPTNGAGPAPAA